MVVQGEGFCEGHVRYGLRLVDGGSDILYNNLFFRLRLAPSARTILYIWANYVEFWSWYVVSMVQETWTRQLVLAVSMP
jgi:hypothetical protein